MIEAQHLSRRFGPHLAVDDLSFRLGAGEVVGFLGPNGAGKTTTMRMLTGYLPPTRGTITIAGFDVLKQSMEVRRRVGYLPESVPLYRELRVEEMLAFHARLHRIPRAERSERIGSTLERVGLLERRRSLVGSLSRGLRQRAGLAVCLLPRPEVLILDEPTSGLDPLQRIEVRKLVMELASEHTVLLSSHILVEVEEICSRVLIVHQGRCLADGRPEDLVNELGGGGAHVRVEMVVPDPAAAERMLLALPGVSAVKQAARVGIHHGFEVRGDGDLREDVGALAAARGWALRELSWQRPSLEALFARLVLGGAATEATAAVVGTEPAPVESSPLMQLEPARSATSTTGQSTGIAPAAPAPKSPPRTLNPFDRGGGAS